jgi:general secretion pathway protein D
LELAQPKPSLQPAAAPQLAAARAVAGASKRHEFTVKTNKIMKMQSLNWNKILGCALVFLFCAAIQIHAQRAGGGGGGGGGGGNRGGGGGGFGGFGGFGGGAIGGGGAVGGAARSTAANSSSSTYNNNGTVGTAQITVDPDTHNLVVIADKQTMEQINKVLRGLDAPKPQVLIKVVFLEVQDNKASIIGVQGSYTGANGTFSKLNGFMTNGFTLQNVTTTANGVTTITPTQVPTIVPLNQSFNTGQQFGLPQSLSGAAGPGGIYSILGNDFTATLQAIAQIGKAEVLSRPSVLARDGQPAQIVVGQEIYLPSGVAYASVGSSGATIPTINGSYQNVGIILNVTPFIGDNSLVQMILAPQISEIDNSTPGQIITYGSSIIQSSPVYAPNIDIRSANTVVITPDGQTVVIGGLIANSKSSGETKIPILGDIPLIGSLFKATTKSAVKSELLIFVTPHIVDAPGQLASMSGSELRQSTLITNSVSEQQLNQFLEKIPVKNN